MRIVLAHVLATVFVLGLIAVIVAVDAFVLCSLWPVVIPHIFPGLVASGSIAGTVSFSVMFWLLLAFMVVRPVDISSTFNSKTKGGSK